MDDFCTGYSQDGVWHGCGCERCDERVRDEIERDRAVGAIEPEHAAYLHDLIDGEV